MTILWPKLCLEMPKSLLPEDKRAQRPSKMTLHHMTIFRFFFFWGTTYKFWVHFLVMLSILNNQEKHRHMLPHTSLSAHQLSSVFPSRVEGVSQQESKMRARARALNGRKSRGAQEGTFSGRKGCRKARTLLGVADAFSLLLGCKKKSRGSGISGTSGERGASSRCFFLSALTVQACERARAQKRGSLRARFRFWVAY